MGVSALKSASITNLDASPRVANTTGIGASGSQKSVDDYVTAVASDSTTSTYRLVRVPTDIKLKSLMFESEAQGAGKFDVGLYYSDDTRDGTSAANSGAVIDQDLFATIIDCASAVTPIEIIMESGTFTMDKRQKPLWQAAGLSSDPGGFFDIVATCATTAVTTGTGKIGARAVWVQ